MSVHTNQVASVLRRAVQDIISRGLSDPRVRGMISITDVRLSDDLADATIFVSVLPKDRAELTMHGLKHAVPHIRGELGNRVQMRRVPRLSFKLDDSLKREAQILASIRETGVDEDDAEPGSEEHSTPEENAT